MTRNYEYSPHIKILPGYAIFTLSVIFIFFLNFEADTILDYKEHSLPLNDHYLLLLYLVFIFGLAFFILYLFLFSILTVDSEKGITIFSRFSTKSISWDQIEEISVMLNLEEGSIPISHGFIFFFMKAFSYHTRLVVFQVKTTAEEEHICRLWININHINNLLNLIADKQYFQYYRRRVIKSMMAARTHRNRFQRFCNKRMLKNLKKKNAEVDITQKYEYGKIPQPPLTQKNKKEWAEQWWFHRSSHNQNRIGGEVLLLDENWNVWSKKYSKKARIIQRMGWADTLVLTFYTFILGFHISLGKNDILNWIFLGFAVGLMIIGIILSIWSEEFKHNSKLI